MIRYPERLSDVGEDKGEQDQRNKGQRDQKDVGEPPAVHTQMHIEHGDENRLEDHKGNERGHDQDGWEAERLLHRILADANLDRGQQRQPDVYE